jgi:hypothetical protein
MKCATPREPCRRGRLASSDGMQNPESLDSIGNDPERMLEHRVDYLSDEPAFKEFFKPRGVLECKATDTDEPTEDPRFGRVGK